MLVRSGWRRGSGGARRRERHLRRAWIAGLGAALALATAAAFFFVLPPLVDARMNRVAATPADAPTLVSADARARHARLTIADLHSDLLLWSRDPLRRHGRGHTDLPRLRDGNVALQVFSVEIGRAHV